MKHALLLLLVCFAGLLPAGEDPIPRPAELERDVHFWVRVYSEITTSEGFIHDERHLGVVYRTIRFRDSVTPKERRDAVDAERKKIQAMLKRLAAGAADLSDDEKAVAAAFGTEATPARFTQAVDGVRFQLGQADRFREGLQRSGAWEGHIADVFANLGLPPELSALPHVESSFDPTAYSKAGAAGLWQFMPATGRRYLRVDDAVDERLDPFRATEAAAQLLDFNYRFLGSWPLALTAYNHGAAGMRRARDATGTTDIATIVRSHRSPSFGFASRNFYVSFLAALEIDRHPGKYFGNLSRHPQMRFSEVTMPAYVPLAALEKTLQVDRARLVSLNPALRPLVWEGRRLVPKGYKLRLPVEASDWTTELLAQQLDPREQYLGQPRARSYKVKSGDTLSTVASHSGIPVTELARLNGLSPQDGIRRGRTLRLPDQTPALAAAAAIAADEPLRAAREPVTATEARAEGPSLVPGGAAVPQPSDPVDYAVASNGSVSVAAAETLGHFADWLSLPASKLRELNSLQAGATVSMGRTLKLDFSKVTREQFETKRRAFHQTLQAEFFSGHRIAGTEVYVTRRGDSLWSVTQRHSRLPTWLMQQYNPRIDFADLRSGMEIVIPKVEAVPPV